MAKINRKYIDKHWVVFILRGILAGTFGFLLLFRKMEGSALYNSSKKHGWINSVIDAAIDVVTAVILLFFAKGDLANSVAILSVYTILSGIVDLFHGFVSTVDPTDRFIRVLTGACGCIIGAVILNAGGFELATFARFFGAYLLIVGVTSAIYGVHNRSQNIEDKIARKQARKIHK